MRLFLEAPSLVAISYIAVCLFVACAAVALVVGRVRARRAARLTSFPSAVGETALLAAASGSVLSILSLI